MAEVAAGARDRDRKGMETRKKLGRLAAAVSWDLSGESFAGGAAQGGSAQEERGGWGGA